MKIQFPFLPVSVNACYGTDFKTRRRFKTKPYTDFIKHFEEYCPKERIEGEIEVEYNFYFPDKRRRDICNYEKALSDTLVHYGVIEDDSNISKMVIERYYDKGKPFTVIEICAKM